MASSSAHCATDMECTVSEIKLEPVDEMDDGSSDDTLSPAKAARKSPNYTDTTGNREMTDPGRSTPDHPFSSQCSESSSKDADYDQEVEERCAHICIECGKFFSSLHELQVHLIDHKTRLFVCGFCDMSFTRKEYLKAHTRTHTGTRPYICKECGAAFAASTNLSKHKRIHSGVRRFKCQFCGRAFVQSGHLKKHISSQHKDGKVLTEPMRQDSVSGSSQTSGNPSSKGPQECQECGAKFARPKNLQIHMLKHTGVKDHVCNECGQAFAIAAYLREHQRTHSVERPYRCSVCYLGFKTSTNLYKHMRIHNGEKRFVCKECGHAFTQSGNLKKHMSRHTGAKPFVCTVCNAAFGREDYLKKHKKSHVGDSLFVCVECGAGFNSSPGLTKHQQSHNTMTVEGDCAE